MKIIDQILQEDYFINEPPVLVDIGASGELNSKWKSIAKYSLCIAFDADDREFQIREETNRSFRKLITINRIVTEKPEIESGFFLTKSPFCSSILEPDSSSLRPWIFSDLFEVTGKKNMPGISLLQSFEDAGIRYVDWFKADTQGTDLRLYKSLPIQIRENMLAAEFEPGIMDAYKMEDKLYMVMNEMEKHSCWLSSMVVKGSQRITRENAASIGYYASSKIVKTSPGWAEITYLKNSVNLSRRQLLLLMVFAVIERQFGFALELANEGMQQYEDSIFDKCRVSILNTIRKEKIKLPLLLVKRKLVKLLGGVNA
jgi:hypothetical protein